MSNLLQDASDLRRSSEYSTPQLQRGTDRIHGVSLQHLPRSTVPHPQRISESSRNIADVFPRQEQELQNLRKRLLELQQQHEEVARAEGSSLGKLDLPTIPPVVVEGVPGPSWVTPIAAAKAPQPSSLTGSAVLQRMLSSSTQPKR